MGCFNKTGFFSHLPIKSEDEIVLFLLVDETKDYRTDHCPIGMCSSGFKPLAPPFFGVYDDYGGITNVVEDANYKLFKKKFGMTLEKFLDYREYFGLRVSDLEEAEPQFDKNAEEKEESEILLDVYNKVFKGSVDLKNLSITFTMEHKAIYDKMVEVAKEQYFDGWNRPEISVEEAFDNTVELINVLCEAKEEVLEILNPLKLGDNPFIDVILDAEIEKAKKESNEGRVEFIKSITKRILGGTKLFMSKVLLYDHFTLYHSDYAMYNHFSSKNFEEYRGVLIDYAYFLWSFRRTNTTFNVSPYHTQFIAHKTLKPIFNEMVNILNKNYE